MNIAILILGIASIVFSGSGILGLAAAIVAKILGKKVDTDDKKVKIGKILSTIGLILSILVIVITIVGGIVGGCVSLGALGAMGM